MHLARHRIHIFHSLLLPIFLNYSLSIPVSRIRLSDIDPNVSDLVAKKHNTIRHAEPFFLRTLYILYRCSITFFLINSILYHQNTYV